MDHSVDIAIMSFFEKIVDIYYIFYTAMTTSMGEIIGGSIASILTGVVIYVIIISIGAIAESIL